MNSLIKVNLNELSTTFCWKKSHARKLMCVVHGRWIQFVIQFVVFFTKQNNLYWRQTVSFGSRSEYDIQCQRSSPGTNIKRKKMEESLVEIWNGDIIWSLTWWRIFLFWIFHLFFKTQFLYQSICTQWTPKSNCRLYEHGIWYLSDTARTQTHNLFRHRCASDSCWLGLSRPCRNDLGMFRSSSIIIIIIINLWLWKSLYIVNMILHLFFYQLFPGLFFLHCPLLICIPHFSSLYFHIHATCRHWHHHHHHHHQPHVNTNLFQSSKILYLCNHGTWHIIFEGHYFWNYLQR